MRKCPGCNSAFREKSWRSDYLVPDGWTRPPYLDWLRCEDCGMIFGDNEIVTQKDYDAYYKERYGYGVTDEACVARLKNRAEYIRSKYPSQQPRIVDFGGGDGILSDSLRELGFNDVWNYGVGDDMPQHADVIIAEHVLEHIYDMNQAMSTIINALKDRGVLIVDVPDAGRIAIERNPKTPILDYSQVHINHFRLFDMLNLMRKWGFELIEESGYHERGSACRMYVFVKDAKLVASASKYFVTRSIQEKVAKLRGMSDDTVCVWGFGDIAATSLEGWLPNVQYFVCNDPAFIGATIQGIPVYDAPIDDIPVIVIAQSQKEKLIQHIKEVCTNRIIEI